jgi:multiple sugar transport system substrate-binding protein
MISPGIPHSLYCFVIAASVVLLGGCPQPGRATKSGAESGKSANAKEPLKIIVVDDAQLGQAIAREWRSRTEETLSVQDVTSTQLVGAKRLASDAVIFPSGLIGTLMEQGLILPLEPQVLEEPQFDHRDIFDHLRLRELRWGNRTVAVPLGSPQLLLAYRADIFAQLGMTPPNDWPEYEKAAVRLSSRSALGKFAPAEEQGWRGTLEPLAEGWAGQLLLARAAPYALHRDQISPLFNFDSLEPLIDRPPYIRALEELAAAVKAGGFGDQRMTPAEAMAELRDGGCAMAVTWPAPENVDRAASPKAEAGRIGFALLPGARQAYRFATNSWEDRAADDEGHVPLAAINGRLAAVSSSTADPRRAQGFAVWLAGREISSVVGPQSKATTLFRYSQLPEAGRWTGSLAPDASKQYAETLAKTFSLPRAFPGMRLPGRLEYLAALDEAVYSALRGDKSAAEALGTAAQQWREITKRIGVAAQRKANARSLGQEGL